MGKAFTQAKVFFPGRELCQGSCGARSYLAPRHSLRHAVAYLRQPAQTEPHKTNIWAFLGQGLSRLEAQEEGEAS